MISKKISIDPITRVEGDVRVVLFVDERGSVAKAYYQALELRGYEAFCKGRAVEELPRISSTICGVCSWSHHIASGKALDRVFGREPPEPATKIRKLAYYLQIIDSHLLHFMVMASPDFVSENMPPEYRNIAGVLRAAPEAVKAFLKSRTLVRQLEEIFGGKPIHAAFMLPGGVSRTLSKDDVVKARELARELLGYIDTITEFFNKKILSSKLFNELLYDDAYMLRTHYMGIIGEGNTLEFYDGPIKIVDPSGREYALFKPEEYTKYIAEYHSSWSYSKLPYLKPLGWRDFDEETIIRVGPLARLNVVDKVPSERASIEYEKMLEKLGPKPIHNTIAYHWARIIETIYSIEKFIEMLEDPDITSKERICLNGEPLYEGVGAIEAPRGTLIHHYKASKDFVTRDVNIITPTTINNTAINAEITKISRKYVSNGRVDEKLVDKIELSIRAYDPCNSCATHALGYGGLKLVVYRCNRRVLKSVKKNPVWVYSLVL